jgi:hypothetical protein
LQPRRGLTLGAFASRTDLKEFEPLPAYMGNCKLLVIFLQGFNMFFIFHFPTGVLFAIVQSKIVFQIIGTSRVGLRGVFHVPCACWHDFVSAWLPFMTNIHTTIE